MTANSLWDPELYERFQEERSQPFFDLLDLVEPAPAMHILDLGCGTGALTRQAHDRFAAAATLGIDRSDTMLAKARADKDIRFEQSEIRGFRPRRAPDLILSNAALQWLDDHPALFAELAALLAPGGQLAIQMPANHDYPTHVLARELAAEEPFAEQMSGPPRFSPVLAPEDYAQLLWDLGFREPRVRLVVYPHVLPEPAAVLEWVKGTLLTYYQERLPNEAWPAFLKAYSGRLLAALRDEAPFFYPFKRVLLWGRKAISGRGS